MPSKKIINKWYHGAGAFHWLVKRTCGFNSLMENVVVEVHSVLSEIRVHISASEETYVVHVHKVTLQLGLS